MKAIILACTLMLQKPSIGSKSKDHVSALERRLRAWNNGDIDLLMKEGCTIQSALQASHARLLKAREDQSEADLHAGTFAKLVMAGKVRSAL